MAQRPGTLPVIPEIVTPASARALFWRPRYLAASGDLWHLPFLFWLTDLARPRVVASIGVGDGVAYFATCQAMERLGQGGRCHGITAGPVAPEILSHGDSHYGELSRLYTGTARSFAGQIADGTVDLLALHGVPDDETVAALSDEWPRKMSARGVILLHGVADWPAEGVARHYLDRLGRDHQTITFEEGEGIVAVLWGADQPAQLVDLAALDPMAPGAGEVRHVFHRLGSAVQTEWTARETARRADAAQGRASEAEAALAAVEAERDAAARNLAELRESHDARAREVAVLQARLDSAEEFKDAAGLTDLMRRHGAAQEELGALRAKLTQAETRAREGRHAEAAARDAVAAAEQMAADRIAAKDRALNQLGTELAALREQVTGRADLMALTMQLEARREEHDDQRALRAELNHLRAERDRARAEVEALLSSTSWKLTGPVRGIMMGLRRLRGGAGRQ